MGLAGIAYLSLGLLLASYGGVLAYFKAKEDGFIYNPDRAAVASPPSSLGSSARRVLIRSSDSITLVAYVIPPPESVPAHAAAWLLYCHGSGGNIGSPGYADAWSKLRALGVGVFAVDYRGYGESGGTPSEAGLYRDAEAAYFYLRDSLRIAPARMIYYGFSLGSAVAIDLASRLPAGALIVEGAFLSVAHRGREIYPFLPVSLLARNRFASQEKIGRVALPKLFIHARGDKVNPIAHGQGLYARAKAPKEFLEVSGGHATAYKLDPAFMRGIARFLEGLGYPVSLQASR